MTHRRRILRPILPTLGWGLAAVFGVIAAILGVELRHHRPSGPNWAEIVTSSATAVLALAAVIALVQVPAALAQTREARLAKDAQARSEFRRKWEALRPVRRKVRIWVEAGGPDALRDTVLGFRSANSPEYTEHEIQFRTVYEFFGENVTQYWDDWKPYVDEVRREKRNANRHFESLAEQIKNEDRG